MPLAVDLNTRLTLESRWFDDALWVDRRDVDPDDCHGFENVGAETITQLCGAPAGCTIRLSSDGQALFFEATGSNYLAQPAKVSMRLDSNGRPYLHIDLVYLVAAAPDGLGAAMLWRIVRACHALNIPRVSLQAVGGRKMASLADGQRLLGHYVWPRFGFDGRVHAPDDAAFFSQFPYFPAGVADGAVASLLDLFERRGGRQFWLVAGETRWLWFEVAPTSRSVLTLYKYLTDKEFF
ncbi:hypothetical protein [Burkholderia territorii]|uniref:hypothetical protein n=1 Tax=Burkholderia territorii TaxID=1503055 RepID=UPI000A5DACCB|nr:hypothetical protein [Burkholderia territorii]